MKRTLALAAPFVTLAVVLAACGSSGYNSASSGGGSASSMPTAAKTTVSAKQVSGVGTVLFDASGMALYTPGEEAGGSIVCTGSCASTWIPLKAGAGRPTGSGDTGTLAVVRRPDGTSQVTAGGRPLYTFAEDSAGSVTGNGLTDTFDGTSFTWHAMLAGGTPATGNATGSTSDSGSSSGGGSYGGGY